MSFVLFVIFISCGVLDIMLCISSSEYDENLGDEIDSNEINEMIVPMAAILDNML